MSTYASCWLLAAADAYGAHLAAELADETTGREVTG
jgi:hypothetical protein